MMVKGNVIDVVRHRECYSVYVRYPKNGKVYLEPVINIFYTSCYIPEQEVLLEVDEAGVRIIE